MSRRAWETDVARLAGLPRYSSLQRAAILGSLYHIQPSITIEHAVDIAEKQRMRQCRVIADQRYPDEMLERLKVAGRVVPASVVCAFHVGSYRLLGYSLVRSVDKLTIVIDKRVNATQGETFTGLLQAFAMNHLGRAADLIFRDTASSSLVRQLVVDLRHGRTVLIYLDGGASTSALGTSGRGLIEVPLSCARAQVRVGAAIIAALARQPLQFAELVPPCRHDDWDEAGTLTFHEPRMVSGTRSAVAGAYDVAEAIRDCWKRLPVNDVDFLPWWESLRYIDRSLVLPVLPDADPADMLDGCRTYRVARDAFVMEIVAGVPFLFDRQRLKFHRLSQRAFDAASALSATDGSIVGHTILDLAGTDFGNFLLRKRLVVPS